MNWYKKAKLIDLELLEEEKQLLLQCSWCKKWATNPNPQPGMTKQDYIWKVFEEMDPEEQKEIRDIEKAIWGGRGWKWDENIGISHGMCKECYNQMQGL